MLRISLHWPDPSLFPNRRMGQHWAKAHRAKKAARISAYYNTKVALRMAPDFPRHNEPRKVTITFKQPDKRKRDNDNMLGAVKAYLDGVSDALGVDDSQFELTLRFPSETGKPGSVVFEIGE